MRWQQCAASCWCLRQLTWNVNGLKTVMHSVLDFSRLKVPGEKPSLCHSASKRHHRRAAARWRMRKEQVLGFRPASHRDALLAPLCAAES